MIVLPFVPGTFASTVEYVIRTFTEEFKHLPPDGFGLRADGSMHSYNKLNHVITSDLLVDSLRSNSLIVTPIYPFTDMHADQTLRTIESTSNENDKIVLLCVDDMESAELNLLFQYYKVVPHEGLGIFFNKTTDNVRSWNANYQSWSDMQRWEQRELLSMYYPQYVQEWIDAKTHVFKSLTVTTRDILWTTRKTFDTIIDYCGLTWNKSDLYEDFITTWLNSQQYIIKEFQTIDRIVGSILYNSEIWWDDLSIVAEAIIQRRLLDNGYEIKCYGMNSFPKNSQALLSELITIHNDTK
jgi:hypothetical protein